MLLVLLNAAAKPKKEILKDACAAQCSTWCSLPFLDPTRYDYDYDSPFPQPEAPKPTAHHSQAFNLMRRTATCS